MAALSISSYRLLVPAMLTCCATSFIDIFLQHRSLEVTTFVSAFFGLLVLVPQLRWGHKLHLFHGGHLTVARDVRTGKCPVLSLPEGKTFHLFLSHACEAAHIMQHSSFSCGGSIVCSIGCGLE